MMHRTSHRKTAPARESGKKHLDNLRNNRRDKPAGGSFAGPHALPCCPHEVGNSAAEQQKHDNTNHQEMPDAEAKHETALFLMRRATSLHFTLEDFGTVIMHIGDNA